MGFYERLIAFKDDGESLNEFAHRAGISESVLRWWRFVGQRGHWPKVGTVLQVSENLNVSPAYLLFGINEDGSVAE